VSESRRLPPGHGLYPAYLENHGQQEDFFDGYPCHFLERLAWENHLAEVRAGHEAQVERLRGRRGIRANVGCGPHGRPGWVNVDATEHPNVDCLFDARKRLPFEDGSVDVLFTEHFVEHLDFSEEAPLFFAECFRSLAPGGVIRVVVPDAGRYLKACAAGDWEVLAQMRPLRAGRRDAWFDCPIHTPVELLNLVFRQGTEHLFAYDCETLSRVLQLHAFVRIEQARAGESRHPELAIDLPERASESLYMEAERP
jgi:predicted SAM-dependent methyltransferase